jgi:hypothetical protein
METISKVTATNNKHGFWARNEIFLYGTSISPIPSLSQRHVAHNTKRVPLENPRETTGSSRLGKLCSVVFKKLVQHTSICIMLLIFAPNASLLKHKEVSYVPRGRQPTGRNIYVHPFILCSTILWKQAALTHMFHLERFHTAWNLRQIWKIPVKAAVFSAQLCSTRIVFWRQEIRRELRPWATKIVLEMSLHTSLIVDANSGGWDNPLPKERPELQMVADQMAHSLEIQENAWQRRPPLWSSSQSSWLQIRRPGFDSRHYQKKVVGLEWGPLSLVSTTEEILDRKVAAHV